MDCKELEELMDPLLDDALDSATETRAREHLDGCGTCATELAALEALGERLREAPAPEVPPGAADRVLEALPPMPPPGRPGSIGVGRILAAALAGTALFGVFLGGFDDLVFLGTPLAGSDHERDRGADTFSIRAHLIDADEHLRAGRLTAARRELAAARGLARELGIPGFRRDRIRQIEEELGSARSLETEEDHTRERADAARLREGGEVLEGARVELRAARVLLNRDPEDPHLAALLEEVTAAIEALPLEAEVAGIRFWGNLFYQGLDGSRLLDRVRDLHLERGDPAAALDVEHRAVIRVLSRQVLPAFEIPARIDTLAVLRWSARHLREREDGVSAEAVKSLEQALDEARHLVDLGIPAGLDGFQRRNYARALADAIAHVGLDLLRTQDAEVTEHVPDDRVAAVQTRIHALLARAPFPWDGGYVSSIHRARGAEVSEEIQVNWGQSPLGGYLTFAEELARSTGRRRKPVTPRPHLAWATLEAGAAAMAERDGPADLRALATLAFVLEARERLEPPPEVGTRLLDAARAQLLAARDRPARNVPLANGDDFDPRPSVAAALRHPLLTR